MENPRIGAVLDQRYRIVERLAAGGMGVIYRGERVGLAKPVAIKFLHYSSASDPEALRRFRREARAMSRLTHPNLSSIIDVGTYGDIPYLVLEYHPGHSLASELTEGALVPTRAVYIARQILSGLVAAHEANVLHRDLKPSNVLLSGNAGEDLVKVLDFGVAKLLDASLENSSVSLVDITAASSTTPGTPHYMSPEQAMAEPVDERTDLYSLGVLLYEMVTGRKPFEGEAGLAILRMHVEDEPLPPRQLRSDLSPELETVIMRALQKRPAARWPDARTMASALLKTPEGGRFPTEKERGRRRASRATATVPRGGTRRSRRSLSLVRILTLLIVVVAIAGGGLVALRWAALEGHVPIEWPAWAP